METLTENIETVCSEFQGFIGDLYNKATKDEQEKIKSMIAALYQMYVRS